MRATQRVDGDAGFLTRPYSRTRSLAATCLLLVLMHSVDARAQPFDAAAVEAVRTSASALLRARPELADARVEIELLPLDPHAVINACAQPLHAELVGRRLGGSRASVRVACADAALPWSVAVGARIQAYKPVVVARVALARGDSVTAEDVALAERDVLALGYGHLESAASLVGARVLRPLAVDAVITPTALARPYLVQRGRAVTLIARGASIDVRAAGTAIEDGSVGEHVRVRNASSGQTVGGIVEGPGLVAVAR